MKIGIAATLALIAASGLAIGQEDAASKPRKKVLVELYTSEGCNSCPPANEFLGQLAKLGFGPDQVVPIAFHVDYFNEPWADPFSSKAYSRRELAYNSVLKRTDLYFTPMMMVDGRQPMLGSNRPEATAAIRRALAEKPGASIKLSRSESAVKVEVAPLASSIAGRDLMVGLTITEGPISTRVPSGENAGKTLVEPFVVRSFAFKKAKFDSASPEGFTFPTQLGQGWAASKCRVAAFVQDWDNGTVYQAESIPWLKEAATAAR